MDDVRALTTLPPPPPRLCSTCRCSGHIMTRRGLLFRRVPFFMFRRRCVWSRVPTPASSCRSVRRGTRIRHGVLTASSSGRPVRAIRCTVWTMRTGMILTSSKASGCHCARQPGRASWAYRRVHSIQPSGPPEHTTLPRSVGVSRWCIALVHACMGVVLVLDCPTSTSCSCPTADCSATLTHISSDGTYLAPCSEAATPLILPRLAGVTTQATPRRTLRRSTTVNRRACVIPQTISAWLGRQ